MTIARIPKCAPMLLLLLAGAGLIANGSASAQNTFRVGYFANANTAEVPDGTVRIIHPGLPYGPICANIYVFDADQQLSECCGCIETPDGLRTLSVNNDLTSNPLTGIRPTDGTINIIGVLAAGLTCDPSSNLPNETFDLNFTKVSFQVVKQKPPQSVATEHPGSIVPLKKTEQTALAAECSFVHILGSGSGICSCGIGD